MRICSLEIAGSGKINYQNTKVVYTPLYAVKTIKDVFIYNTSSEHMNKRIVITTTDGIVSKDGNVVHDTVKSRKLHFVSYVGGGVVESILLSGSRVCKDLNVDMTRYSDALTSDGWMRLQTLMNGYAGREYMGVGRELSFTNSTPDLEAVYLLLSESFLTPTGYSRIVVIEDRSLFDDDKISALVHALTSIRYLGMVLIAE